jgi:multiple antibiotic resistance protein
LQPALCIAGEVVLFLIALRVVFPDLGAATGVEYAQEEDPFIVPMAIPLIAGPSAVAVVLLLSNRYCACTRHPCASLG